MFVRLPANKKYGKLFLLQVQSNLKMNLVQMITVWCICNTCDNCQNVEFRIKKTEDANKYGQKTVD